jgi:putative transposase
MGQEPREGKGSGAVLDNPLVIPYSEDIPRPRRVAEGGLIYHALNRANARLAIFQTDEDYAAFQRVLAEAVVRHHMRLLAYCLMPNHFHVLLWPREDGDPSRFMSWLTMTHTQRWHACAPPNGRHRSSRSALVQVVPRAIGRAFPHGVPLCRAERLAGQLGGARRGLAVGQPGVPRTKDDADRAALTPWPIDRPRDWTDRVNRPFGPKKEEAVRRSIQRGQPYCCRPGRPRLRNDWVWSRCYAPDAVRERSLRAAPDPFSAPDGKPLRLTPHRMSDQRRESGYWSGSHRVRRSWPLISPCEFGIPQAIKKRVIAPGDGPRARVGRPSWRAGRRSGRRCGGRRRAGDRDRRSHPPRLLRGGRSAGGEGPD